MPLISPVSYLPAFDAFLSHWATVELLTGTPFVLPEATRAEALVLQAELAAAMTAVTSRENGVEYERAAQVEQRAVVRQLLDQFNTLVRVYWEGTPWPDLLPKLPPPGVILEKYLRPCREAVRVWVLLETEPLPPGAPNPLRVGAGASVGRVDYAALLENLRLRGLAAEEADFQFSVALARRNALLRRIRALLISYTKALPARVPDHPKLLETLPRLWALPGHTPDAVEVQAAWMPEKQVARLEWTRSEETKLASYEVRACQGPKYVRKRETVVAKVAADAEPMLETSVFLTNPGSAASFKVYVLLKTGNAKGSTAVGVRN